MPEGATLPSWKTGELGKCIRSPYLRTARNFLPILYFGRTPLGRVVQLVAQIEFLERRGIEFFVAVDSHSERREGVAVLAEGFE